MNTRELLKGGLSVVQAYTAKYFPQVQVAAPPVYPNYQLPTSTPTALPTAADPYVPIISSGNASPLAVEGVLSDTDFLNVPYPTVTGEPDLLDLMDDGLAVATNIGLPPVQEVLNSILGNIEESPTPSNQPGVV